jgi:hypothetical protein
MNYIIILAYQNITNFEALGFGAPSSGYNKDTPKGIFSMYPNPTESHDIHKLHYVITT